MRWTRTSVVRVAAPMVSVGAVPGFLIRPAVSGANFRRLLARELSPGVVRIELQPRVDREVIVITDIARVGAICDCIVHGCEPDLQGDYSPTTCRIEVIAGAGTRCDISIRPTGESGRSPLHGGAAATYAVVHYGGYRGVIGCASLMHAAR